MSAKLVKRDVPKVLFEDGSGLKVVCLDERDHEGGASACHWYQVLDSEGEVLLDLKFQHGAAKTNGQNGVQHIHLLMALQHRYDCFQGGQFTSDLNEVAATAIDAAISADQRRTRRRSLAGAEGRDVKVKGVEKK